MTAEVTVDGRNTRIARLETAIDAVLKQAAKVLDDNHPHGSDHARLRQMAALMDDLRQVRG